MQGVMQGKALIKKAKGGVYEGQVNGFVLDGYGKFTNVYGEVHEGEWRQGKAHGPFKVYMPEDKITYDFEYKNGELIVDVLLKNESPITV